MLWGGNSGARSQLYYEATQGVHPRHTKRSNHAYNIDTKPLVDYLASLGGTHDGSAHKGSQRLEAWWVMLEGCSAIHVSIFL